MSYPLPGTPFHDKVKEQLGAKTRWDESNDLAMMFQGTYRSEFYRAVRDLLHQQVDLEKLNLAGQAGEYRRRRATLQQRWKLLIAREQSYRTPLPDQAVASA